ncbi:hypothetical protein K1719_007811 [Acacia pycnantha]|nr:hypothetical protein K1719_007811 [Acacia pycnantha]
MSNEAEQRDVENLSIPLLKGESTPNKAAAASDNQACNVGSTSFIKTCLNCLNALSGVGILSVPYALASGGWLSLILLFIIAMSTFYTASGVFASFIIICSIFWTATIDGVGFNHRGTLINWEGIPTAVSLYTFCYCAHPVFPTMYNSTRRKPQFSNVLLVCFVLSTFGYAAMAIFGYLMYGSDVQSQITLDLPVNRLSSKVAIFTTLVNPMAKYALMVTPITNALKEILPADGTCKKSRLTNILIGTALVIIRS